jgi:SLA1 homology domain 1, SHD1
MRPLIVLLISASLTAAEIRTWTDDRGRNVEAELVTIEGDSVTLKLKDGRNLPFPLAKLSDADRAYVDGKRPKTTEETKGGETPAGGSEGPNFNDPWPDRVSFGEDPEVSVVSEDAAAKKFIYESANYRYVCDVRLARSVVKGFAVMFESTHLCCRTLPIGLSGGKKTDGKYLILLFETREAYVKADGPPSSAGVYISRDNTVMVPLTSLGVRPVGSGYMLDRDKSNKTLPHELVHQLTPVPYYGPGSMGWFTEGIAEYVAVTPYRSGSYNVRSNLGPITEYVTSYGSKNMGGRALGKKIALPHIRKYFLQDYQTFLSNPQVNYGTALLITTYFFQMDGKGDGARIKAFLKALLEGKEDEAALKVLLDGRSYEQLQDEIAKSWRRRGVDFTFGEASSS